MNESEYRHLCETSWRRALNADEEARLQADLALHPEAQADWEAEAGLTQALGHLQDAPLPSNFTAQVLQAVEREEAASRAGVSFGERLGQWVRHAVPRLAWACALLALGFIGYHQYRAYTQDRMARGLIQFAAAADLKDPAVFKDLEAILRVGQMPPPSDEALWAALEPPAR